MDTKIVLYCVCGSTTFFYDHVNKIFTCKECPRQYKLEVAANYLRPDDFEHQFGFFDRGELPVKIRPKCDFCSMPAIYDTATKMGPWAFTCQKHFDRYSTKQPGLYTTLKVETEVEKRCSICGQMKKVEEYYKYIDNSGTERYRTECKECNLAEKKKWRFKKG